jgi:hypothetical protein
MAIEQADVLVHGQGVHAPGILVGTLEDEDIRSVGKLRHRLLSG